MSVVSDGSVVLNQDKILSNHLSSVSVNAKYTSAIIQETIIEICGDILREDIACDANNSAAFLTLADETDDISGTEQMSLGVRFDEDAIGKIVVREEFLGYISIEDRTAEGLANIIIESLTEFGLNMTKLVRQGYDGGSTVAGKEGGDQALLRRKYSKAAFVH